MVGLRPVAALADVLYAPVRASVATPATASGHARARECSFYIISAKAAVLVMR